jgi:hypothetical protein
MRFRITVRGDDTELRGYIDGEQSTLRKLALLLEPFGLVVASTAAEDYNPFRVSPEDLAQEFTIAWDDPTTGERRQMISFPTREAVQLALDLNPPAFLEDLPNYRIESRWATPWEQVDPA